MINPYQWVVYARLLSEDKEKSFEKDLHLVEYLASFWNYEAVKKIRDLREMEKSERFDSAEKFEEKIKTGKIVDDEVLDILKEVTKTANYDDNNADLKKGARNVRLPKENQTVFNLAKKRFE